MRKASPGGDGALPWCALVRVMAGCIATVLLAIMCAAGDGHWRKWGPWRRCWGRPPASRSPSGGSRFCLFAGNRALAWAVPRPNVGNESPRGIWSYLTNPDTIAVIAKLIPLSESAWWCLTHQEQFIRRNSSAGGDFSKSFLSMSFTQLWSQKRGQSWNDLV